MKKLLIIFVVTIFSVGCTSTQENPITITAQQLSENNGKSGNSCYVAVSGKVYEISGSNEWIDGEHIESEGQASCGKDLTALMNDSPHGVSILTTSPRVKLIGTLE